MMTLGKAEAALAEIVQLIAENKFEPNYLIGMINGIAEHGPRQGEHTTKEALAFEMITAWETSRRGKEIYGRACAVAGSSNNDVDIETALAQMDIGEQMEARGDALTNEIDARAEAAGVLREVLAVVEPLYHL